MMDASSDAVARIYDDTHEDLVENADRQGHWGIRHGYYDGETADAAEAAEQLRRAVAEPVDVAPSDTVLDVGCGFGADATWLADRFGASVLGVNVSEPQLSVARDLAAERAVADRVTVRSDDFHDLETVADDSVDVVWAVEALAHARSDETVVEQFRRVLRDGGRVVVADLFRPVDAETPPSESLQTAEDKLLVNFEPLGTLLDSLEANGFEDVERRDVTDAIRPSARRHYWYGLLFWPVYRLKSLVTSGSEYESLAATATGFRHQYRAIDDGELTYAIVSAELPS